MARWTGLEPATPGVTGRYSNQLSYHRTISRSSHPERGALIAKARAAVNGLISKIISRLLLPIVTAARG